MRNAPSVVGLVLIGTICGVYPSFTQTMPRYSTRLNTSLPATADQKAGWDEAPGRFRSLILHPTKPANRFAIGDDQLLYRSTDSGESWAILASPFPQATLELAVVHDTLYALGHGLTFARSSDLGATWETSGAEIVDPSANAGRLLIDPDQPEHLIVADRAIWESRDGGGHFAELLKSSDEQTYTALAFDRGHLLAATAAGTVVRIANGSVINVSKPRDGAVSALVIDDTQPGKVYVTYATPKRDASEAQVYVSDNGGFNWVALDGQAPEQLRAVGVRNLAIAPGDSNRLYLATADGIMVSLNGGAGWLHEDSGFNDAVGLALQSVDSQLNLLALNRGGTAFAATTASSCKFTISPGSATFMAERGTGTVNVTASSSSCAWRVSEGYSWITITGGATGKGSGKVSYSVAENGLLKARETRSMRIAGQPFVIKQSGTYACSYKLVPANAFFPANAGGSGTFQIQAPTGCAWTLKAGGEAKVTSAAAGSGTSTVSYSVAASSTGGDRFYVIELRGSAAGLWNSFQISLNQGPAGPPSSGGGGGLQPPNITPVPTTLTTPGVNVQIGQSLDLGWSIFETVSRRAAGGAWVTLSVNGVNICTSSGTQCKFTVNPALFLPGSYPIRVTFPGNGQYLSSSGSAVLNVRPADTALTLGFCAQYSSVGSQWIDAKCPYNLNSIFTAVLRRSVDRAILAGRTVRFFANGSQVGTAVTNTAGTATLTVRLPFQPRSTGAVTKLTAIFDGDQQHNPTTVDLTIR